MTSNGRLIGQEVQLVVVTETTYKTEYIINYNETCIISNMITEKELHSLGFFKLDDTQVYINPAHSPLIVLFQNGIGFIPHIFSNTENVFKPCKMILEIFELEELLHS